MQEREIARASPSPGDDYERLRQTLALSVSRTCPGWLSHKKDDIVQTAMVRVLEIQKKNEQNHAPPPSYLWKVAYTATVAEIRKAHRRREVSLDPAPLSAQAADRPDPLEELSALELGRGIQFCLGRLREARRLAVGFHLLGHSLSEIETLLGWNPKRVRNLLYRGLADLRSCLTAKGFRP